MYIYIYIYIYTHIHIYNTYIYIYLLHGEDHAARRHGVELPQARHVPVGRPAVDGRDAVRLYTYVYIYIYICIERERDR